MRARQDRGPGPLGAPSPSPMLVLGLALAVCTSCGPPPREILVTVSMDLARADADRYAFSVFRRTPDGARWQLLERAWFQLPPEADASIDRDATRASDAFALPTVPGRHLLRLATMGSPAILVEVQPARLARDGRVLFVGPPAAAQFENWPTARGSFRIDVSRFCIDVDTLALGPWQTCEAAERDIPCPAARPLCVRFGADGNGARVRCDEDPTPLDDAGAAGNDASTMPGDGGTSLPDTGSLLACPAGPRGDGGPPDASSDAGTMDVANNDAAMMDVGAVDVGLADGGAADVGRADGGGIDASMRPDAGLPRDPFDDECVSGSMSCGRGARWSRCIHAAPCVADPEPDTQRAYDGTSAFRAVCCTPRTVVDCTLRPASGCGDGLSCFEDHCDRCGQRGQRCCAGFVRCLPGEGRCDGTRTCVCGLVGQQCCGGNTCSSGVCTAGMCEPCGALDQRCCGGSMCSAGLACVAGLCRSCGTRGRACCDGTTCTAGATCAMGTCVACGAEGERCCTTPGAFCTSPATCTTRPAAMPVCTRCAAVGQPCTASSCCVPGSTCAPTRLGTTECCMPSGASCAGSSDCCFPSLCSGGTCT